jgi:hypothetical protein
VTRDPVDMVFNVIPANKWEADFSSAVSVPLVPYMKACLCAASTARPTNRSGPAHCFLFNSRNDSFVEYYTRPVHHLSAIYCLLLIRLICRRGRKRSIVRTGLPNV